MILLISFYYLAFALNDKEVTGDEKHTSSIDEPQYWQAILGDICQLPSFPRATGDPQRYVECVKQNLDTGDRLVFLSFNPQFNLVLSDILDAEQITLLSARDQNRSRISSG